MRAVAFICSLLPFLARYIRQRKVFIFAAQLLHRTIFLNIYIPFIAIGHEMDYTVFIFTKERDTPWKKIA